MHKRLSHPLLLPLLLALLMGVFVVGCEENEEPATVVARPSGPVPQQQFFDYRLTETTGGIRQWVLESDEMQKFAGQEDLLLITVKMNFYQNGEHFSTLTSDSGRANLQTRNVHTWGDVVVLTNDGRRLDTSELFFDNQTQLIHNDVFDSLTRTDDVVTGIGLEATPDLEYIEIKRQVAADVSDDTAAEGETR